LVLGAGGDVEVGALTGYAGGTKIDRIDRVKSLLF